MNRFVLAVFVVSAAAMFARGNAEPISGPALHAPGNVNTSADARATGVARAADQRPEGGSSDSADPRAGQTGEPISPAKDVAVPPAAAHLTALRTRVESCLAHYAQQLENAASRSPWGVMHTLLPWGATTEIIADGRRVNAIGWLCYNRPCRGQRLFQAAGKRFVPQKGPGLQGHAGQFLAMLAQSKVPPDFPLAIGRRKYAVTDLIEHEQRTCRSGSELTFKLIGLSHYLDSDTTWNNDRGATWSVSRLIEEELRQPVVGAACGGTHRMMGFSYAVQRRKLQGKPISGQWERAETYVTDYRHYTFQLQNADGSFSTSWFEGRGDWGGPDRKLQTTGHILEWLVFSTPTGELTDPRLVRAVRFLTNLMLQDAEKAWQVGPRGHALRALVLYRQRLFDPPAADGPASAKRAPEDQAKPAEAHPRGAAKPPGAGSTSVRPR